MISLPLPFCWSASGARGLALVAVLYALSGCASLDVPERPGRVPLSETGLAAFNGVYTYSGADTDCTARYASAQDSLATDEAPPEALAPMHCRVGFSYVLDADDRLLFAMPPERGFSWTDSSARVRLEAVAPNRLRATLTGADGTTWTEDMTIALRRDGYARLRARSGLVGFPPFIWGIRGASAQIGLDARGDLVYDHAGSGIAFITIMPVMVGSQRLGPVTFRRLERE